MKPFLKICFALTALILLFSSCGKNNEVGKMIPSDALFVAQVNMKSLDKKLSWDEIKQTSWYKEMYADSATNPWKRKLLDNPSASGIDFDDAVIFFVANAGPAHYVAVEGKLKSEKDFEEFNKNFSSSSNITKEGDVSLLALKDKNVVGWKGDHFIYVMNANTPSADRFKWDDSTNTGNSPQENSSADLSAICKNLFSLKSDSSLAKNDKFGSLLKSEGDIVVWQNTEAIIKSSPAMGMLGMMKIDAFTKDNISTYAVNFDKGKIDVDQKMYVSKELTDIVNKYLGKSINMEMVKNIPSQNVFGLLAFNFKPEGIVEMLKLTGADGIVNTYAQQMGFTLDDFSKSSNGDGLLAFTDFKMNADSKPDLNYLFSAGIGDKASLEKIIDAVKKTSSQMGKDSLVNYVMNDKIFALANNNTFASQYLSGSSSNKYTFDDKISGHPVGFFLDINKILSQFSNLNTDNNDRKAMLDESLKTWDNIVSSGGEYKNNGFAFHTEINLINKDTNSLKQLNNYFNQMYNLHAARKEQNTQRLDSLLVPPPHDTVNVK
ncbi:MAG: DUF4836 family protein [Ginsengibacter sp.]